MCVCVLREIKYENQDFLSFVQLFSLYSSLAPLSHLSFSICARKKSLTVIDVRMIEGRIFFKTAELNYSMEFVVKKLWSVSCFFLFGSKSVYI